MVRCRKQELRGMAVRSVEEMSRNRQLQSTCAHGAILLQSVCIVLKRRSGLDKRSVKQTQGLTRFCTRFIKFDVLAQHQIAFPLFSQNTFTTRNPSPSPPTSSTLLSTLHTNQFYLLFRQTVKPILISPFPPNLI